jgi:RND family efflux transporter MFP subunit
MQIDQRRQQAVVSNQEAERASKEAERASKEAAVTYARQQRQRVAELYEAKVASKQELDQADTALRTAEGDLQSLDAQVRQQQAQLQQQEVQLRYYTVAAPTSGIVGDVPVRVGMQVSTQTLLTTVDQNDTLEVYVSVPVDRADDLKKGLRLDILNLDDHEPITMTTVNFISPHVDEQTQSILVKAPINNPGGALRSSQLVRARIVWKTAMGLVVPVTGVSRVNGQFFAFVADGRDGNLVARQRAIKVGPIVNDDYPVLDGIKPGERVIVSGSQKLVDGVPIVPATESAAPAGDRPAVAQ